MADAKMLKKVPVREQDPKVRATNFEEVCLGYNQEEAMEEAQRCLGCKKPKCVEGCPVSINIPGFIEQIKEGKIEEAYKVIGLSSALPAICGRVCPQESQCEGKCIRGIKGEAVSIGKLERFVADYALEHDIKPAGAEVKNSIISSGCIVNGKVENSIIFKDVYIGNNCTIKNSIILNDVYIGDDSYIENCIVESRDTLRPGTNYVGTDDEIKIVIEKNVRYIL